MDKMTVADLEGNFLMIGHEDREKLRKVVMSGGIMPPGEKFAVFRAKDGLKLIGGFKSHREVEEFAEGLVFAVRRLFQEPMGH